MSAMQFIFWLVTVADILAALLVFLSALTARTLMLPLVVKLGLITAAFGFAAQGGLNLPFLLFGQSILAQTLPFWILKDIGITVVIAYYYQAKIARPAPARPQPVVRKGAATAAPKKPGRQPASPAAGRAPAAKPATAAADDTAAKKPATPARNPPRKKPAAPAGDKAPATKPPVRKRPA